MSNGLVVTTAGMLWVSEDEILALATSLKNVQADIRRLSERVAAIQVSERDPFTEALRSVPAVSLGPIAGSLERLLQDAEALGLAVRHYAEATADQERWRIASWEVPREQLLSLMTVVLGRGDLSSVVLTRDISPAAKVLLGKTGPHSVVVQSVSPGGQAVDRATSLSERVERIPDGESPIRIERYQTSSGSWESDVYIAGTQHWGLGSSAEPFDMESNLALVAGVSAASLVAVQAAMKKAGVRATDRVHYVGHSQGGLLASRLAQSGRYLTGSVLTVGAPLGTAPADGSYPALAIAHTDDLVPGVAGAQEPTGRTLIETHSGSSPLDVAGAHSREGYAHTAERVDASPARESFPQWDPAEGKSQMFSARREGS